MSRPISLKEYFPDTIIYETWFDKIPKDLVKYKLYNFLTYSDIANFKDSRNLPRNFLTEFDLEREKKYQENTDCEDRYYFNLLVDPYMKYMYKYQNIKDFQLVTKCDKVYEDVKYDDVDDYIYDENESDDENDRNDENIYFEYLDYLDKKYMDRIES